MRTIAADDKREAIGRIFIVHTLGCSPVSACQELTHQNDGSEDPPPGPEQKQEDGIGNGPQDGEANLEFDPLAQATCESRLPEAGEGAADKIGHVPDDEAQFAGGEEDVSGDEDAQHNQGVGLRDEGVGCAAEDVLVAEDGGDGGLDEGGEVGTFGPGGDWLPARGRGNDRGGFHDVGGGGDGFAEVGSAERE